jgi:hypothetical protein
MNLQQLRQIKMGNSAPDDQEPDSQDPKEQSELESIPSEELVQELGKRKLLNPNQVEQLLAKCSQ